MAILFNGSSQSVYLTTANSSPASSAEIKTWPCTFACWVNPVAFGTNPAKNVLMALDCTVINANNRLLLYLANNTPSMLTNTSGGSLITSSTQTITTGSWFHVAMSTGSRTRHSVYVNGVATNDFVSNLSFPLGQNNICIGADFNAILTQENYYHGNIAFPSVWNLELSQADITALYNSGSGADPRTVQPTNLLTLMLFAATNTFQDNITTTVWTAQGSPTQVADPFAVGLGSPVMTVQGATLVTTTTATLNGTIVFTRGVTPTIEGFNYGTTTGYGTNVSTTGTYSPGAYSIAITGLTPATIYHFRSFATNSSGTGVSSDGYFTTQAVGLPPGTPAPFYEKLGYSCNFDQQGVSPNWNPPVVMPLIAASGAMWIRDTVNWSVFEDTAGVFSTTNTAGQIAKSAWMTLIHTLGMKFCGLIQYPPKFYGNVSINQNEIWPIPECAAFCAWLAGTGLVDAIELVNEANNVTQFQGPANNGSNAKMDVLVQMTVLARAAVRAAGSTVPVIGLDEQGSEVIYMASPNPLIDGVVYHPYDLNDETPEHTYEPPYLDYVNWVRTVQGSTNLPIWETEFAGSNVPKLYGEYSLALWWARRFLLSWWLGVPHTFIYNFTDGPIQSVVDFTYNKRQAYWMIQRLLLAVEGTDTTGQYVTVTNPSAGLDISDLRSTVFCSSTTTVASIWFGNNPATYKRAPAAGTATISFRCINTHVTDSIVDSMSGNYLPLSTYSPSLSGKVMTLTNFPITDVPQFIKVSGASQASAPLVATYLIMVLGTTTVTLTGGITFNGGASSTITGFNYGTTTAYGSSVSTTQSLDTGNFSNNVTGLTAGVTYHYQSFATNANGTGTSDDATFFTQPVFALPGGTDTAFVRSYSDILLESIIQEKHRQVVENLAGAPEPLPHGVLADNALPIGYQVEYLKNFQQLDYVYRV